MQVDIQARRDRTAIRQLIDIGSCIPQGCKDPRGIEIALSNFASA